MHKFRPKKAKHGIERHISTYIFLLKWLEGVFHPVVEQINWCFPTLKQTDCNLKHLSALRAYVLQECYVPRAKFKATRRLLVRPQTPGEAFHKNVNKENGCTFRTYRLTKCLLDKRNTHRTGKTHRNSFHDHALALPLIPEEKCLSTWLWMRAAGKRKPINVFSCSQKWRSNQHLEAPTPAKSRAGFGPPWFPRVHSSSQSSSAQPNVLSHV